MVLMATAAVLMLQLGFSLASGRCTRHNRTTCFAARNELFDFAVANHRMLVEFGAQRIAASTSVLMLLLLLLLLQLSLMFRRLRVAERAAGSHVLAVKRRSRRSAITSEASFLDINTDAVR